MGLIRAWVKRLHAVTRRRNAERQLDEELRFHLTMEIEQHLREGATPSEARRRALIAFGGVERWREEVRDAQRPALLIDVAHDIRYGVRLVRRRPGFAAGVIITLALGIGASTSIFSVVDGVVFRPLPYVHPERLVAVWETYPHWRGQPVLERYWERIGLAWPDYVEWRDRQRAFSGVAVYSESAVTLMEAGRAERLDGVAASASILEILGGQPALGRFFLPGEDGPGAARVAVISHGLWTRRFGADSGILGRRMELEGKPFEIVGVLPRNFDLASADRAAEIWTPVGALDEPLTGSNHSLRGLARLEAVVPLDDALAETARLLRGTRAPDRLGARLVPLHEAVVAEARPQLLLLLAAAGVLLLIACVNAAVLMLTEVSARRHEVATRASLGAAPARLARQLLVESLVHSVLAAALGAALALLGTRALVALAPADLPRLDEIAVNARVLSFATGVAFLVGIACGIVPALSFARTRALGVLRLGDRRSTRGSDRRRALGVGAELAVVTVLLTVAMLLSRSLLRARALDPGFRPERLLIAGLDLPQADYATVAAVAAYHDGLLPRLRAIPGVEAVSGVTVAPFTGERASNSVGIEGLPESSAKPEAEGRVVLPDYFRTMDIPFLAGRSLARDPHEMIVSERMARTLWPGSQAVGRRVSLRDRWYTVVGVVGDVRDRGAHADPDPTFYVSHHGARDPALRMRLIVRTAEAPEALAPALRRVIAEWNPSIPVSGLTTMDALARRMLAAERYRATLVSAFALLALLLAAAGVFGHAAHLVRQKWRELGVRLALGAPPHLVLFGVLRRIAAAAAIGLAMGVVIAIAIGPLISRFLFGVSALDPVSLATAATVLFIAALIAGFVPARRAATLDPANVLRSG